MRRFFDFLRRLFSGNSDNKYVYRLFNRLLQKYGIARDGSISYARGRLCSSEAQYESHVNNVIKPAFKNLLNEGLVHLGEKDKYYQAGADKFNSKAADAEKKMDETDENGKLYEYQQEIDKIKSIPSDTENIDFPETRMEKTSKSIFHIYQQNVDKLMSNEAKENGQDQDILPELLDQKKIAMTAEHTFISFKNQLNAYSAIRHSSHLPARQSKIRKLILLCFVITCGEVGITSPIINRLVDLGLFGRNLGEMVEFPLALLYAIVVSLSLAVLLNYLANALLNRNARKTFYFWLTCFIIFLAMALLFSLGKASNYDTISFWGIKIGHKALVLAFFSVMLALANALVYREASYLRDIYSRQKQTEKKRVEKEREKHFTRWSKKAERNRQKAEEQQNKAQKNSQIIEDFKSLVGNQETICINCCREGFEHAMRDVVLRNNELILTMTNHLKKEL